MSQTDEETRVEPEPFDLEWTLAGQVIRSADADEAAVVDVRTGADYTLRGLSLHVWRLLDRGTTAREIRREVLSEYQGDVIRCETDIATFLNQLAVRGLVVARVRRHVGLPEGPTTSAPDLPTP